MTKTEALTKIKELEKYIEDLDNKVGFEDDELFLLSVDEYIKYQDIIQNIGSCCWWWLQSPGYYDDSAAFVGSGGSIGKGGVNIYFDNGAVRPALKLPISLHYQIKDNLTGEYRNPKFGDRISYKCFPFICTDEKERLFIAEVPIGFHRFDEKSNDYATSEIRQYIKDWAKNRY